MNASGRHGSQHLKFLELVCSGKKWDCAGNETIISILFQTLPFVTMEATFQTLAEQEPGTGNYGQLFKQPEARALCVVVS